MAREPRQKRRDSADRMAQGRLAEDGLHEVEEKKRVDSEWKPARGRIGLRFSQTGEEEGIRKASRRQENEDRNAPEIAVALSWEIVIGWEARTLARRRDKGFVKLNSVEPS